MVSPAALAQELETLQDLVLRLGSIPLERIRLHPAPGTATEADVLARPGGEKRLCELVEGVLVEKPMGYFESRLAALLIVYLEEYLKVHDLGIVLGEAGTLRLLPGLVRVPDVSFIAWQRFPNRELPRESIPDLAPDLAVEVLSPSNTEKEMERKRREYFSAGTRMVWIVDPEAKAVRVYSTPEQFLEVNESQELNGGAVLPGFSLSVRQWFERAGKRRAE